MTKTEYTKNPNTKTTYTETEKTSETITERQYKNIVGDDTLKWFRRLGGSETALKGYTCRGYNVVKLTSCSPDRQTKVVRQFKFN